MLRAGLQSVDVGVFMNGPLGWRMFGRCRCIKVSRFPLCFLSPHLSPLFPRRGGDDSHFELQRPLSQIIDAPDDRRCSGASATRRSDMSSTSEASERPDWWLCARGVKVTAERDKLLFDLIRAPAQTELCDI